MNGCLSQRIVVMFLCLISDQYVINTPLPTVQCCCLFDDNIFSKYKQLKHQALVIFNYTHKSLEGRKKHTCLHDWVRVKCEDLSSKLFRVRMTRMCSPIVNRRVKSLTLLPSILLCRRKPSFQTSTAFLSETESWHALLSLGDSLQCRTIKILPCNYYKEAVWI